MVVVLCLLDCLIRQTELKRDRDPVRSGEEEEFDFARRVSWKCCNSRIISELATTASAFGSRPILNDF
nr:expressed protein [Hymenolepis microstoma]